MNIRDTLFFKPENLAALSTGRNFHLSVPVKSRNLNVSAQYSFRHAHIDFCNKIIFPAFKNRVLMYIYDNIQIAAPASSRFAFAANTPAKTVVRTVLRKISPIDDVRCSREYRLFMLEQYLTNLVESV